MSFNSPGGRPDEGYHGSSNMNQRHGGGPMGRPQGGPGPMGRPQGGPGHMGGPQGGPGPLGGHMGGDSINYTQ